MIKIDIPNVGKVEVKDSFMNLSKEEQNQAVKSITEEYLSKQETTSDKVIDKVGDAVKYTAKEVGTTALDLTTDTLEDLPGMLVDLSEGRVDKIALKLGVNILNNVGSLVLRVGTDGLITVATEGGKVLYKGLKQVDVPAAINKLKSLENPVKNQFGNVLNKLEKQDKKGVADDTKSWFNKVSSDPKAAGLGFADEMSMGIIPFYGQEPFDKAKERSPEAYGAGEEAGLIGALAGGPAAASKAAGNITRRSVQEVFRNYAKRKNIRSIEEAESELKKLLKDAPRAKLGTPEAVVMDKLTGDIKDQLSKIDSLLKTFKTKRLEFKDDPKRLREWWQEAVGELPENHTILKNHPDIYDNIFDRMLRPDQKTRASGSYFKDRLSDPIISNVKLLTRNWPRLTAETIANVGGDFGANYIIAYNHAQDQGMDKTESADFAWAFTIDKTPYDVSMDILGKVTDKSLLSMAPTFGRVYLATGRVEDGKIIDPRGKKESVSEKIKRQNRERGVFYPSAPGTPYNRGGLLRRLG